MTDPTIDDDDEGPDDDFALDDDDAISLDALLRSFVLQTDDKGRTWADRIITRLVESAADGDARSQHEIFHRIGAPPRSDDRDRVPDLDDWTVRKILEVSRGQG